MAGLDNSPRNLFKRADAFLLLSRGKAGLLGDYFSFREREREERRRSVSLTRVIGAGMTDGQRYPPVKVMPQNRNNGCTL